MKPKIVIAIDGGLVTAVATNLPECEVVVVDYDLMAHENSLILVSPTREQDDTFEDGKSYLLFDGGNYCESEAAEELKRRKY